jgi:hypothetical protein
MKAHQYECTKKQNKTMKNRSMNITYVQPYTMIHNIHLIQLNTKSTRNRFMIVTCIHVHSHLLTNSESLFYIHTIQLNTISPKKGNQQDGVCTSSFAFFSDSEKRGIKLNIVFTMLHCTNI